MGLIEDDCHMNVLIEFKTENGKIRYYLIHIIFNIRDLPFTIYL